MKKIHVWILAAGLMAVACNNSDTPENQGGADLNNSSSLPQPLLLPVQIINQYRHDTLAFTEGLSFYNGRLFESTGAPEMPANNGTWISEIDLPSGRYDRKLDFGNTFFGEGTTFLNDKVYQLTYTNKKGFVYDAKTFKKLREFNYNSEGWGLTNDGKNLIMSTGSSNLYYLDPDSLGFVKMLPVQDRNGYASNLNELEYINGFIYANQWMTDYILKIDPATGYVVAKLDLGAVTKEARSKAPAMEELNGIAYDSVTEKTFITGKKWPYIYEIKW